MALTKVTGDFIKAGSITQGHLHSSHGITTSHITEGDKVFFTNARVANYLSSNNYVSGSGTNNRLAVWNGTGVIDSDSDFYVDGDTIFTTNLEASGSLTVSGGNLVLGGTGRIQGIDTVSANTDAANKLYVDNQVAGIVDSAPGTLDTLNELAAALGDDANFSTTVTNSIATKMPLAGGTFTGQVIFPSAATTKPVLPNGFISRNDLDDTSGRHDIWGISERYYPSNSTTGDAWGIQWSGTPNDIVFVGGGTDRFTVSLDEGNITAGGTITASGGNSTQWNTAYTYSQVGHLPLAGGTLTGVLTGVGIKTPYVETTTTNQSLFLRPNGTGHLYIGDSGNGSNIYHYSAANDGVYTSFSYSGNYYQIDTTATSGIKIIDSVQIDTSLSVGKAGGASGIGNLTLFSRYSVAAPYVSFKTDHPSQSTVWETGRIESTDSGNFNGKMIFKVATGNGSASGGATMGTVLTLDDDSSATFAGNVTATTANFSTVQISAGSSYNENIRMFPGSNGYSSLILGAVAGSSGTGTGQWSLVRYPNPTHQQKFSIRHNSTDHITIATAGHVTNHVDTRSPIFYSSSDTSYYLYPNNQLSLKVYGEIANSNVYQGSMQPGALNVGRTDTNYRWDGTTWASDVKLGMLLNFSDYYEIGFHDSGEAVHSFVYYNGTDFEMGRDIGWGTNHFTFTESVRSPIFYDSGNTAYYTDPASRSILNDVNADEFKITSSSNNARWNSAGDWGTRLYTDAGYIHIGPANTSHAHIYTDRADFYFNKRLQIDGGTLVNVSDVRSAAFYDINNTGRYIDPSSTSRINRLEIENTSNQDTPTAYMQIGSDGFIFGGNNSGYETNSAQISAGYHVSNSLNFVGMGTSSSNRRMDFWAEGGFFVSGIIYDKDSTSHYLDLGNTSVLNGLTVGSSSNTGTSLNIIATNTAGAPAATAIINMSGYEGRAIGTLFTDVSYSGQEWFAGLRYNGSFGNYQIGYDLTGGQSEYSANTVLTVTKDGNVYAGSNFYGNTFYDSNNTSYFIDPSGGQLRFQSTSWTGEFPGKMQYHGNHWYIQADGYIHFRNASGTNTFWVDQNGQGNISNFLTGTNSLRAPLFYDSQDTNYYLDPAGNSRFGGRLNSLIEIVDSRSGDVTPQNESDKSMRLRFTNQIPGNGNWQSLIQMKGWSDSYASWQIIGPSTTTVYEHWYLRAGVGSTWNTPRRIITSLGGDINHGQLKVHTISNTAGSQLMVYSNSNHQYPQIYSNGSLEAMWNYKNTSSEWYVGIRTSNQLIGSTGFHFYNTSQGQTVGGWDINGHSYSIGSSRAPIFYDSNNTGYYINPASTSFISYLSMNNHIEMRHTSPTIYLRDTNHNSAMIHVNSNIFYVLRGGNDTTSWSQVGGRWPLEINLTNNGALFGSTVQAITSFSTPIYYSSVNTAYYVRPATSSYINSLQTNGNIQAGASGTGNIYVGGTSGNHFRFHTHGGATYFDMNSGTINWRQGSSTRYYFYPSTANMTINGTLTQYSDIRYKENIVEIPDAIDKVKSIRGVYYNRTDFNTEPTKIGVIAQEVEVLMPELILQAEDTDMKSVSYNELTAVLVQAIKEQQTIIDDLKSRLETLENQ